MTTTLKDAVYNSNRSSKQNFNFLLEVRDSLKFPPKPHKFQISIGTVTYIVGELHEIW